MTLLLLLLLSLAIFQPYFHETHLN